MAWYIISDLHLSGRAPKLNNAFTRFVSTMQKGDRLFILGDLFNFYVCRDPLDEGQNTVAKVLADAKEKGINIFFIIGNRDFLLKEKQAALFSMKLLPEFASFVISKDLLINPDLWDLDDKDSDILSIFSKSVFKEHAYISESDTDSNIAHVLSSKMLSNSCSLPTEKSYLKSNVAHLKNHYFANNKKNFVNSNKIFVHDSYVVIDDFISLQKDEDAVLLIMSHGDLLCTNDKSYMRYQRIVRNPFVQALFNILPMRLKLHIAAKVREQSANTDRSSYDKAIYGVNVETVNSLLTDVSNKESKHLYKVLVHGHIHELSSYTDVVGANENVKDYLNLRYVLGFWGSSFSYIKVNASKSNNALCSTMMARHSEDLINKNEDAYGSINEDLRGEQQGGRSTSSEEYGVRVKLVQLPVSALLDE